MKARCKECGFAAHPEKFEPTTSAYHDLRCPECGTTNIDTSELKAADPYYGYGNDNFLTERPWYVGLRASAWAYLEALSGEVKP